VNAVLHDLPVAVPGRAGRPRKYGERLGSVKAMQTALRATARTYSLNLYGQVRDVVAAEQRGDAQDPALPRCAWSGSSDAPNGSRW
jgi:hypothetical protein